MHADGANAVCSTVSQKQWTPCVPEYLHCCEGRKVMGKRREILLSLPCQQDLSRFGTKAKDRLVWIVSDMKADTFIHISTGRKSGWLKMQVQLQIEMKVPHLFSHNIDPGTSKQEHGGSQL